MTERLWTSLTTEQALESVNSNLAGLTSEQALIARNQYGSNELPPVRGPHQAVIFLRQFKSSLIYILVMAAGISFMVGEWADGLIISGVILLNAIIGFIQEAEAGTALQKLLRSSPQLIHVLRDQQERELNAGQIVVGDIVILATGDQVPADGRWLMAVNVKVNESSMTGEAVPVEKITSALPSPTQIQDQLNMGWRGTTVVAGRGRLLVTATGGHTRFGGLLAQMQTIEHSQTPWQEKLQVFSRRLATATVGIGLALFVLGLFRHLPISEVFLLSVSMIVSIIPEGLPLVMTIATAAGITAMARRQAIVRHPAAVETLGAVTVVAADKTGTLTFGEMMVEKAWVDGQEFDFSGAGYEPNGDIWLDGTKIISQEYLGLHQMLKYGALNNDSRLAFDQQGQRLPIGDPTELALLVAAGKAGWSKIDLDNAHPRRGEFPFDHQKKFMVTWHDLGHHVEAIGQAKNETILIVKGAPQEVLELCSQRWHHDQAIALTASERHDVLHVYERWASQALRGLAVAYRIQPTTDQPTDHRQLAGKLIFIGLVGMADAIRPEAAPALRVMAQAGIRTIMLTGDHYQTGRAVAIKLGLIDQHQSGVMLDGHDLDQMSDADLRQRLQDVRVGTRLTPEHKLRIATSLKLRGEIVAMTGDGINDVPALLAADVGIAVGRQSSDAAKEAADMILTDGNFLHLTEAIAEGRRTLRNIRRVVVYLLASNFGELVLIMVALLAGLPPPLLPKHIIWLNALTDPFLGVALAREPRSASVMLEKPHGRDQPLISPKNWERVIVGAATIGLSSLVVFTIISRTAASPKHVFAVTLTTIALGEWFLGLALRSSRQSVIGTFSRNLTMVAALVTVILMQVAILYIAPLTKIFNLTPLTLADWGLAITGALPILLVEEIRKIWIRRQYHHQPA